LTTCAITVLDQAGMLGPDVQLVHPMLTTAEERAIMKARGMGYSISPVGELRRSSKLGVIQFSELLEDGVKISLSTDHSANYNCDPFGNLRLLFALHLHRVGNDKVPLTMKRLVQLGTSMARSISASPTRPARSRPASAPTSSWCGPPIPIWLRSATLTTRW
jgi:cytosine/adenosine deaminase-related metal-dependent hydrolase